MVKENGIEEITTDVIHLETVVGGIEANRKDPGILLQHFVMVDHLMEYCRQYELKKFVGLDTICSYSKETTVTFKNGDLWEGYPEEKMHLMEWPKILRWFIRDRIENN